MLELRRRPGTPRLPFDGLPDLSARYGCLQSEQAARHDLGLQQCHQVIRANSLIGAAQNPFIHLGRQVFCHCLVSYLGAGLVETLSDV